MYHTLGHLKNQIAQEASQLVAPVRLIGENHVAHLADCLIAATSSEKAQLIDLYGVDPAKIAIVPPGVDLGRFAPTKRCVAKRRLGLPKTERLILFVGRIEPLKGIDTLLEAVSLLQQQHPAALENVRVGLIGGNPHAPDAELSRLLALHAQLKLGETVEFLGARDQNQLPDYYAAASVVVMPSHYESFGMVALEAMAMGTPVIASRVGGLAHLVRDGETGFLMPPRQPQALADRLHCLLTDDALLKELSTQAQQYAQTYNWANVVDRMLDVYDLVSEPVPVVVR
jgi:D-inositol-3-phosphate glycosyltransferase